MNSLQARNYLHGVRASLRVRAVPGAVVSPAGCGGAQTVRNLRQALHDLLEANREVLQAQGSAAQEAVRVLYGLGAQAPDAAPVSAVMLAALVDELSHALQAFAPQAPAGSPGASTGGDAAQQHALSRLPDGAWTFGRAREDAPQPGAAAAGFRQDVQTASEPRSQVVASASVHGSFRAAAHASASAAGAVPPPVAAAPAPAAAPQVSPGPAHAQRPARRTGRVLMWLALGAVVLGGTSMGARLWGLAQPVPASVISPVAAPIPTPARVARPSRAAQPSSSSSSAAGGAAARAQAGKQAPPARAIPASPPDKHVVLPGDAPQLDPPPWTPPKQR